MKRVFDFILALCGLVVLSPLFLALSLIILITMGWPIFFRQERVGKNAVPFRIVKFRSMIKDAAKKGPVVTAGGDPRITPVGRFLRKTKLDELPQLINVFWGDMSLVGPRPEVPKYVKMYNDEQLRVLAVRPGLTDPASIAYSNEEEILAKYEDREKAYIEILMPAKLKLNISYIDRATFFSDVGMIFKTIGKIISRK
ncbi:MAG: sugar transferase [Candidatus Zixiibacteriota bacterium]